MPADPDQLITIKRPIANVVDSGGIPLPKPIELRTIVARRNVLAIRVTFQVEPPPIESPPGTPNRLRALVIVLDVQGREVDIAILDQFDGKRLDHFYDHMTAVGAILEGDVEDTEIVFKTTDDFPAG